MKKKTLETAAKYDGRVRRGRGRVRRAEEVVNDQKVRGVGEGGLGVRI